MPVRVLRVIDFHPQFWRVRSRWLLVLALVALAGGRASAQLSSTSSPELSPPAIELPAAPLRTVLDEGARLESLRRWGDALTHYDEALRLHPDDPVLRQREDLAKLHWSLERRYTDRSYLDSLQRLSPQQASGLYMELLRKISAHYVVTPPWAQLARRGTTALELALTDEQFRSANRVSLPIESVAQLVGELDGIVVRRAIAGPGDMANLATDVARTVEARTGVRQTASILEFITASAGGLDEYSAYLTSDQLRDVYSQIEGNFVGLGVELKADNGALLIVHVIPGSPAERAGIRDLERIVAVDGKSTAQMSTDEAAALLTGAEGTFVRVSVASPQATAVGYRGVEGSTDAATRELTVRREHVEVPSLEGVKIVRPEEGVAYVRIPAFQKTTSRDLEAALWDLHRQGMRSLVLDLRGNPGGLLTSAVEVADKFLQDGGIVSTRGRSPQEDFNYQAHYGGTWRVPLVVLIDRDSASASEIFAGAIKDNARGVVVGERSYGKGSVQGIFPLGYGGAGVRLTTALFFSPSGQKISHHGVTPNREVHSAARPVDGTESQLTIVGTDPVLDAGIVEAIGAAKARVASR